MLGMLSPYSTDFPPILDINPLSTIKTITDWPVFRPPFLFISIFKLYFVTYNKKFNPE